MYKDYMKGVLNKKDFPESLKQIYLPPDSLNYKGDISLLSMPAISIVGTRKSTTYGEKITEQIIAALSSYNAVIVSGLALGIDKCAHQAAIKYGLKTIAVLGSGLNNIYPKENLALSEQIVQEGGLLLSEYSHNIGPKKFHFPQRNRLVSAISLATVVVEAPAKSGAMITARFALEQGKEIFTIPGDIDRPNSEGPLQILQRGGAYPVSSGEQIVEILADRLAPNDRQVKQANMFKPSITSEQQLITKLLSNVRGKNIGQIQDLLQIDISTLLANITELELLNIIEEKNGLYYLTY